MSQLHPLRSEDDVVVSDTRVVKTTYVDPPIIVKRDMPTTPAIRREVEAHRQAIANIMHGRDPRFLLIAGPCSIFNERGTLEFAKSFKDLADHVSKTMLLVMRAPPDKPRTKSTPDQWEGLIHEAFEVGKHDSVAGIRLTRKILLEVAKLGVPVAIEFLDNRRPRYFNDIMTFSWTGARTNQNGGLRRQNCGLNWPVAIKNGNTGELKSALDAIDSANHPNYFDAINDFGNMVNVDAVGNPDACLIMRGGETYAARNFNFESVQKAQRCLRDRALLDYVIIDSAHGNSLNEHGQKDHMLQLEVFDSTLAQWLAGNKKVGGMVEAYLKAGNQKTGLGTVLAELPYDRSPTDPTISLDQLTALVLGAHEKILAER